ncbi:MAG: hypothetical protein COA45_10225 [Zetaproteobacteria bacterium]|nr:MAG: hypothetical protein COA45_10225 [Zetaproteobacteria bacterium]
MLVFDSGRSSLIIGCICFLGALFFLSFGTLNVVNAETDTPAVDDSQRSDNSVVKIPPPIEGIVLNNHKSPRTLKKADIWILSGDDTRNNFTVELALTTQEQQVGMMFRRSIAPNTGMLFLFEDVRERNFWMKNTVVSLDIIFIRKDGVIHHIYPNAEINSLSRISSSGEVSAVLEIGAGEAQRLGLHVGDRVLYEAFLSANLE